MKKNSFLEGTIIATLAIMFVKLLGMLYVIPFYRIVGSTGGALYSYGYNIYLIFLNIASAGLPSAISKVTSEYSALGMEDAKQRSYKIANRIISGVSVVSFVILFVFAEQIGKFIIDDLTGGNTYSDVAFVVRCVSFAVLLVPYLSITRGYLQGHKVITPSSRSQLIEQVVRIAVIIIGSFIVIKVANGTVKIAIGIAMTGAFFAGVAALIYLKSVMRKNKKELFAPFAKADMVSNKEIASKVISYAIPFVIISVVTSIYTFTDQILVLRTLNYLDFDATDVEFAASAISTWSPKIGMIISSVAMGMAMNLIPAITSSYATKNMKDVQNKINKSVAIMLFVSVPMAIGLAVLSKSVWTVFYGPSTMGPQIMALAMFVTVAANVSNTVSVICQSLSKYKLVYGITFVGFILNAALDVPVMLLFSKIGIPAYLGSLAASLIGYTSSSILGLAFIKKTEGVKYGRLRFYSILTIMPSVLMAVVIWPLCHFLPFNQMTTGGALLTILIVTIVGVLVYGGFVLWSGFAKEILGEQMMNRITSKFSRLLKRG